MKNNKGMGERNKPKTLEALAQKIMDLITCDTECIHYTGKPCSKKAHNLCNEKQLDNVYDVVKLFFNQKEKIKEKGK